MQHQVELEKNPIRTRKRERDNRERGRKFQLEKLKLDR